MLFRDIKYSMRGLIYDVNYCVRVWWALKLRYRSNKVNNISAPSCIMHFVLASYNFTSRPSFIIKIV